RWPREGPGHCSAKSSGLGFRDKTPPPCPPSPKRRGGRKTSSAPPLRFGEGAGGRGSSSAPPLRLGEGAGGGGCLSSGSSFRGHRHFSVGLLRRFTAGVPVAARLGCQLGDVLGQVHAADVPHDLHHRRHGPGQVLQEVGGVRRTVAVASVL